MFLFLFSGQSVILHSSEFEPISDYYKSKISEYKITRQPSYGLITTASFQKSHFTQKELDGGFIQYTHDGSENFMDFFELIAIAKNKQSMPFNVTVIVIPVNDQIPTITINNGLQIWNGGRYIIKNTDLSKQSLN